MALDIRILELFIIILYFSIFHIISINNIFIKQFNFYLFLKRDIVLKSHTNKNPKKIICKKTKIKKENSVNLYELAILINLLFNVFNNIFYLFYCKSIK
jgi:hypothetical protein